VIVWRQEAEGAEALAVIVKMIAQERVVGDEGEISKTY
jgi:hypothetical protein